MKMILRAFFTLALLASQDMTYAGPKVIDHTRNLAIYFEALDTADSVAERREMYRRYIASGDSDVHAEFVGEHRIEDPLMERITDYHLQNKESILEAREFVLGTLPEIVETASKAYGASLHDVPIHVTLNLFQSNASVRMRYGEPVVLIGLDTNLFFSELVTPVLEENLRTMVAHELFHAHHWRENKFMGEHAARFLPPDADAPLWVNLWSEGLASCAGRIAYPDATEDQIFGWVGLWDDTFPRLAELSAEILDDLDSSDTTVTGRWLFVELPERSDGLPNRAGYTVAMVAAHAIVERVGLDAAVELDGDKLRQALVSELTRIAEEKLTVSTDQLCRP